MARPKTDDPLIPLPVRLPTSVVQRLKKQAESAGVNLSDVLRSHLTVAEAKPLGKPRPQRRQPKKLAAVSGADPILLRELAGIGNNINQLARKINSGLLAGKAIETAQVLIVLQSIERELSRIGNDSAH